jgi:hypothetical protein
MIHYTQNELDDMNGESIAFLLIDRPEFIDKVDVNKMDICHQYYLIEKRPELQKYCKHIKMHETLSGKLEHI